MKFLLLFILGLGNGLSLPLKEHVNLNISTPSTHSGVILKSCSNCTYEQAISVCAERNRFLALLSDLEREIDFGFQSCVNGWLADTHVARIKSDEDFCSSTKLGLTYKRTIINQTFDWAYCTNSKHFITTPYNPYNKKEFSFWVKLDPAGVLKLKKELLKFGSSVVLNNIGTIYPSSNIYKLNVTTENEEKDVQIIPKKSKDEMIFFQKFVKDYFPESNPEMIPHVQLKYGALKLLALDGFKRDIVLQRLADQVKMDGWDGIMIDYEPNKEYTFEHATRVVKFLNSLTNKLHKLNLKIGFCISDWGVLKYWNLYSKTKVDVFSTMSMTYNGRHMYKNLRSVISLSRYIEPKRIQVGLKSCMHMNKDPITHKHLSIIQEKRGEWLDGTLEMYLLLLKRLTNIKQIHVWPETWEQRSQTCKFFYNSISIFSDPSHLPKSYIPTQH